jgi:hypothetical protein
MRCYKQSLIPAVQSERTLTSKNEGLKRDLEGARTARDVAVKDKELVQQAKQAKLQQFQDSIRKSLVELWCDTEASLSTLGGRSAEFPASASLSDFFKWFRKEIKSKPPPLWNATWTLLVTLLLVFSKCLREKDVNIYRS